jgi:hypothetical protein
MPANNQYFQCLERVFPMIGKNRAKKSNVWIAGMLLAVCCTSFAVEEYGKERYQVILDRSPFGADPLIDSTSIAKPASQSALAKDMRLCMLLEGEDGDVRAGLQTLADKKSFILAIGETAKGVKLLDIDIINSQALLERDGERVLFKLDKGPAVSKALEDQRSRDERRAMFERRFGSGFGGRGRGGSGRGRGPEPQKKDLTPKYRGEELKAHLQDYQMEVIRRGMPPLPIPLSQEMDDQLVSEGVLPPVE